MKNNKIHGKSNTAVYHTWEAMKSRCLNPNDAGYKYYGGRGIIICDKWRDSFIAFYEDMGEKPFPKAQIDRINNEGNYESGNCRWVTCKENRHNSSHTKLTMKLAKQIRKEYVWYVVTISMLAKKYNVDQTTIWKIIRNKRWMEETK